MSIIDICFNFLTYLLSNTIYIDFVKDFSIFWLDTIL